MIFRHDSSLLGEQDAGPRDREDEHAEIMRSGDASASTRVVPTFCVLIPTYNGQHFLRRAIRAHAESILINRIDDVDIVISDNASRPETEEVVREMMAAYPFVKYVRQARHLDTAEEHFFEAVKCVEYDYVWSFGDDDIPLPDALPELLALARTGRFGCIMGNLRTFSVGAHRIDPGRTAEQGLVPVLCDQVGSIADIIAGVGFQTVAACISVTVIRRESFLRVPFGQYLAASAIYSHVAAYMDAFSDETSYFVAKPIVDYRTGATTDDNWERFAARRAQPLNTPWTFGILRLFSVLISRKRIDASLLLRILEHAPDNVFYTWSHILHRVIDDFEQGLLGKETVDALSDVSLHELCRSFSASADPLPLELAEQFRRLVLSTRTLLDAGAGSAGPSRRDPLTAEHVETVRSWALQQAGQIRAAASAPVQDRVWRMNPPTPLLRWGEEILFADPRSDAFIVRGVSGAEPWGRWTDGARVHLRLQCPAGRHGVVVRLTTPMTHTRADRCDLVMWVSGGPGVRQAAQPGGELRYRVDPDQAGADGRLDIHLRLLAPKSVDEEPRGESRALGVGLATLRIDPVEDDDGAG